MLEVVSELFRLWNEKEIQYCHWKSNEHLVQGLDGRTDMDVLVNREQQNQCESVLKETNYKKFVTQKSSRYPDVEDYIGFDFETGKLVHLHLHYEIVTGKKYIKEFTLPWKEIFLASRILDEKYGIYIANPNLELLTLYTRIVLKSNLATLMKAYLGRFSFGKYIDEIEHLKSRTNHTTLDNFAVQIFGESHSEITKYIWKPSLSAQDFLKLSKTIKRHLRNYARHNSFVSIVKRKYYNIEFITKSILNSKLYKLNILKKAPIGGGKTIVFIGVDGSGKSTISNEIQHWLAWKIDSHRFYLGSGKHYVSPLKIILHSIKNIKYRMRETNKRNEHRVITENVEAEPKKRFLRLLFKLLEASYLICIARRCYCVLKKVDKYKSNGGIAILDRYPQIQFEGIYDGPKISFRNKEYSSNPVIKLMGKIEKCYLHKAAMIAPDILIKLIISPDVSKQRRPDHKDNEIELKTEITEKIVFENSAVFNIDASQDYDREKLEIKRIIWNII